MQVQQTCSNMVQRVLMKYTAQDGYVQSKNVATYFKVRFIPPKVEEPCCSKSQYLSK